MAETTIGFDLDSLVGRGPQPAEQRDDGLLVEGLRLGAEEAYETLIERYQQPVYNLVFRLLDDPADTRDVVQEVFLKVFRYIDRFRGQSSLKTWIYRIAVNEARNQRRWSVRHLRREVALDQKEDTDGRSLAEYLPDRGKSPYEITLGAETRTLVEEELAHLRPVFRQAVVLRDVEDLTYEEVSEVLGISVGTVKSRILRGREALRKSLRERLKAANPIDWAPESPAQGWRRLYDEVS